MQRFLDILRNSEMLQSKKFRAFVIGLFIWGLEEIGITSIDPVMLERLLMFIGSYIGFQALSDFSPRYSRRRIK